MSFLAYHHARRRAIVTRPTARARYFNIDGDNYTDAAGKLWEHYATDYRLSYAGFGIYSPGPDAPLYETASSYGFGDFTIPPFLLPDGDYTLVLRGQELFQSSAGGRVQSFAVGVSDGAGGYSAGQSLFDNVDWWRPGRVPVELSANITVTDGQFVLYIKRVQDNPIIQALAFIPR